MPDVGAFIAGIEYALPERRISNAELAAQHPTWRVEQTVPTTGVLERRWVEPGQTALDLAETACRALFERNGFEPGDIDVLLFCTQSPDHPMPPNACLLQDRLSLPRSVAALDYTLACSGFIYGLFLARALVVSGSARHVLLVTSDTYSTWSHPDDRAPRVLFGDGAAATLISAGRAGLGEIALATDGAGASTFMVSAGGARRPRSAQTQVPCIDGSGNVRTEEHLYMNGAAVLDFVKREVPPLVCNLLARAKLSMDDLDLVLLHQASRVTLDQLYRALKIPRSKRFENLEMIGNTVSASLPILLRDAETRGVLQRGMKVMLVGFGVGLSWGGCILEW